MATPYLQIQVDETPSTQDLARERLVDLPVVVIARRQSEGRGRSGAAWMNAPAGLAVSLATQASDETRPVSLMAGVAALRSLSGLELKWPNDLMRGEEKVGGILVERSDGRLVVGMGVNLWWPDAPDGIGGVHQSEPAANRHAEMGALWAAELLRLLDGDGWPIDEYRSACSTIGRAITWEPDGRGVAVAVDNDGSLVVESDAGRQNLHSGSVAHIRG
jgi:BirA family biotin operon repressor/biotin-[acetyl-CoA-carboxylase] ligase